MKQLLLLLLFSPLAGNTQNSLDKYIEGITFGADSIEAIFKYVATTISYNTDFEDSPIIYHSYDEVITDVLTTKSGVCMHYANLFDAIVKKLGYKSYVISGYTKFMNQPVKNTPHAWNAVNVKGEWYLYDPTWAAGFVVGNKFLQQYQEMWYKKTPEEFIYSHIPFDPMWQFRVNASTHKDIMAHNYDNPSITGIDFNKMRHDYSSAAGELEKLQISLRNITAAGITNKVIQHRVNYLKEQIAIFQYNQQVSTFNNSVKLLKEAHEEYNTYITAKRSGFNSWTPESVPQVVNTLSEKVTAARDILLSLKEINSNFSDSVNANLSIANKLIAALEREEQYAAAYIKRNTKI